MTTFISMALLAPAVLLCFKVLAKISPYAAPPEVSPEELDRLRRYAEKIDLWLLPVFLIGAAGFTLFWAWALSAFAQRNLDNLPAARFLLKPEPYFLLWFVPGLFLGLISIGSLFPLMNPLMRFVLGPKAIADYSIGSQARFNVSNKAYPFFLGLFTLIVVVLIVFLQDWYIRFEDERIAVNPFLSIGEAVYRYDDIDRLVEASHVKAPNGNVHERMQWHILFRDGRRWCNEDLIRDNASEVNDTELRDFLSKRTGKIWEKVRFIDNVRKNPPELN